mmetsp:Transcript_1250/g.2020  ORF Transcript_1250/g.2020 Transcript_1250/m.2020 type:complete len:291 (+) Transcript_1250:763-1635(+)
MVRSVSTSSSSRPLNWSIISSILSNSSGTTLLTRSSTSDRISLISRSPLLPPVYPDVIVSSSKDPLPFDLPSSIFEAANTTPSQFPAAISSSNSSLELLASMEELSSWEMLELNLEPDPCWLSISDLEVPARSAAVAPTAAQSPASMAISKSARETSPCGVECIPTGLIGGDATSSSVLCDPSSGMNTGSESSCVTRVVSTTALAAAIVARALVGDPVEKPSSILVSNDGASCKDSVFNDDIPALLDHPEAPALDESSLESMCLREDRGEGIPATIGMRVGSCGGEGSIV